MKINGSFTNWIKKLLLIEDHSRSIDCGFSLGSFIGLMPIPGFQLIVSINIASILKINRKAAGHAVFNTNLLTGAFIFALNFWIGKSLLGISTDFSTPEIISIHFVWQVIGTGVEVFLSMVLGGILTGIIIASSSYFLIQWILSKINQKNEYR